MIHSLRAASFPLLLFASPATAVQSFDCVMDPSLTINLGAAVPGLLQEVLVDRGDEVRAGDIVARLSSSVERETERLIEMQAENESALEAQRARVGFLIQRLTRTQALADRGIATVDLLQEIEAEVEVGRSLLRQAEMDQAIAQQDLVRTRAAIGLRDIRSPIEGLVVARHLAPGEYLQSEAKIVTIVALDPLYVEAFMPVSMFGQVVIGDTATVRPSAPFELAYSARVTVVDRVFDAASGTFGVRLELENPGLTLPAGHRCVVEF